MSDLSLNRIRILKTGLADVQRYIDVHSADGRRYFEELAEPGTELKLKRVHDNEQDPFRIEVFSPDNRYIGRVTVGKNETAARLMDAGMRVIAVVNDSLPVHDSDSPQGRSHVIDPDDPGWNEDSREVIGYDDCNLPYSLYLADE